MKDNGGRLRGVGWGADGVETKFIQKQYSCMKFLRNAINLNRKSHESIRYSFYFKEEILQVFLKYNF